MWASRDRGLSVDEIEGRMSVGVKGCLRARSVCSRQGKRTRRNLTPRIDATQRLNASSRNKLVLPPTSDCCLLNGLTYNLRAGMTVRLIFIYRRDYMFSRIQYYFMRVGGLLIFASYISGCTDSARIEGKIVDPFQDPIQAVSITIENSAFSATSDGSGRFNIDYAPGKLALQASKPGHTTEQINLELSQKVKYPLNDTILYPIPQQAGIYILDNVNKKVMSMKTNAAVFLKQTQIGSGWDARKRYTYRTELVGGMDAPIFKAGKITFIVNGVNNMKLNAIQAPENGIFNITNDRNFMTGVKTIFLVEPKQATRLAGKEKLVLQTFELGSGMYAWVEYFEAFSGDKFPKESALQYACSPHDSNVFW